jgi:hypothetical protein
MSVHTDAADRYADACARRALLLAKWEELGFPVLDAGGATGRAVVPHALIGMLREADALCDRLEKSLKVAQRGRPAGSASSADRVDAPAAVRLKAVP